MNRVMWCARNAARIFLLTLVGFSAVPAYAAGCVESPGTTCTSPPSKEDHTAIQGQPDAYRTVLWPYTPEDQLSPGCSLTFGVKDEWAVVGLTGTCEAQDQATAYDCAAFVERWAYINDDSQGHFGYISEAAARCPWSNDPNWQTEALTVIRDSK